MKKLSATALAMSLLASPVAADDWCSIINDEDVLTFYEAPAAHVQQKLDAVKREMCFRFSPLVKGMVVEPDNVCVPIDEDNTPKIQMKFPSGASLDVGEEYGSDRVRWLYDSKWKSCRGLLHARVS